MKTKRISPLTRLRPRINTLYVSQGRTVLAMERDGFIKGGPETGLFVHETRMLSNYQWQVNGKDLIPATLSNVEQHSWLGYYTTLPPGIETLPPDEGSGQVRLESEQTLELCLSRYMGEGMHEDVNLTNYSTQATSFILELEIDADFADQSETYGHRQQKGRLDRNWRETQDGVWELFFDYQLTHRYSNQEGTGDAHLQRGLRVCVENSSSTPGYENNRIRFTVHLAPRGIWHACLTYIPVLDGENLHPHYSCRSFYGVSDAYDQQRGIYLEESTQFQTAESQTLAPVVIATLEQARRDLASLRLYDLDHGSRAWTVAAGLPIYVALFGRDTLTASWQAGMVGPELMRGTLQELALWQGRETNDWRDEQPGKMIHEAHTGPLEILNVNPRQRYYGSITTSGLYPLLAAELWHWTADREVIQPLLAPMFRSLEWLDTYGDLDGDGFYEYQTRSRMGSKHQAWKDSRDGIVDENGDPVDPPIATCEEQAFIYVAKLHAAEMLWWLDRKEEAQRLHNQAKELKKRFHDAFWMPEEGFYALGLDAQKRQIRAITSNPGHCLAASIAADEAVRPVAERLFQNDMFTGWGIRTLSDRNPAYNPYSYHRGSIWPVEHGTFALGLMRYGHFDLVEKISLAQFRAAALFEHYRLPELFCSHPWDDDHPFPAIYLQANSPQAWSASSVFCLVQAMLGLYPYAPLKMLLVDPHLPAWLPELRLSNLRVGEASVDLRFFRLKDGRSDFHVEDQRGTLHVVRQPSPWSQTAGWGERMKDFLVSLLPGK